MDDLKREANASLAVLKTLSDERDRELLMEARSGPRIGERIARLLPGIIVLGVLITYTSVPKDTTGLLFGLLAVCAFESFQIWVLQRKVDALARIAWKLSERGS
jgi:hypothetical protein